MKECRVFYGILIAIGICFGLITVGFSEDQKVPEKISIDVAAEKFKPAEFNHRKHQDEIIKEEGCIKCHHMYKEGKKLEKCSNCHTKEGDEKAKGITAKKAFHKNCKDCHKEQKKAGNVNSKTKCTFCHEKQKKADEK